MKSLRPIITRSAIDGLLAECGELKGLSPTVAEILKLTRNESTTADQVARVIKRDHAIALRILKLANSSAYTRGEPVDSIDKAVLRIGMETLGQAVLNVGVVDCFVDSVEGRNLDIAQFWEHSIGVGIIAAEIARARASAEPDKAFTLGLLHDVGKLVYGQLLGERYTQVVRTARSMSLPVEQVEGRMLLVNHAEAMDRILHAWRFPRDLIDPIVFHHLSLGNIRKMAARRVDDVATLALANRLAHALLLGASGNETIYNTIDLCKALRLTPAAIAGIERDTPDHAEDMKLSLLSMTGAGAWQSRLEHWRATLAEPIRPLVISPDAPLDAVRVVFSRLAESSGEAPNLAVVNIAQARDRVPLTAALRDGERQMGVSALPTVVFSSSGEMRLEESAMAERYAVSMAMPVTLECLIAGVNGALDAGSRSAAA